MTKEEVIEKTGESVYGVWLEIAVQNFDALDPESSFIEANNFVKELLKQNPEF